MRLWIIGNGFDLFHGLHTRYLDYKAYLCQKNPCICECANCVKRPEVLPRVATMKHQHIAFLCRE